MTDGIFETFRLRVVGSNPVLKWLLEHEMDPNLSTQKRFYSIRGKATPLNTLLKSGGPAQHIVTGLELLHGYGAVVDPWVMENAINWRSGGKHERAVLQWLVEHGADVDCPLRSGSMLLHAAVSTGNLALVTFLLHNGANVAWKDPRSGLTAWEMAKANGWEDICDALDEH